MKIEKWQIGVLVSTAITCTLLGYRFGKVGTSSHKFSSLPAVLTEHKAGSAGVGNANDRQTNPKFGERSIELTNSSRAEILAERESSGQARAQGQIEMDGYEMMFIHAGVASDQISLLLPALSKVIKYSMIEEQSTIDVLTAKKSYESLLNSILSSDQLEAYNRFESQRPVSKEMAAIVEFGGKDGIAVDQEKLEIIQNEVAANKAFSSILTHGPFDEPFRPTVGREDSAGLWVSELERLKTSSSATISRLQFSLNEQEVTLVQKYYDEQIRKIEYNLWLTSLTSEEVMELMMRRTEDNRASAGPPPP